MPRRSPPAVPPPRPEVLAFLRDAKDHPEDDTPRLVLADWLDEHGDEADQARAAHLRAQCRLARLKRGDPGWAELTQEVQELEDPYAIRWLGLMAKGGPRRTFVRGLVQLRAEPTWLLGPRFDAFAATESWAWVEGLEVERHYGPTGYGSLVPLARCAALRSLGSLSLFLNSEDDLAAVRSLAATPHLANLVSLTLDGYNTASALELLLSQQLGHLSSLRLSHYDLNDAFIEGLATCPALANLQRLTLNPYNRIGDAGVRALLASPHLRDLTVLEGLADEPGRFSDAVRQALAERFGWPERRAPRP
jgi:uncharacterized protein (TIGR02996 family)